jgi:tRNA A37 threonylcarbamoyladenosine dehydratase
MTGARRAGPMDMQQLDSVRRFRGVARVYGQAGAERIADAHVCVIGTGGVGSWTVEALARSGVGRLTLIDLDHVAESNINRQLHALGSTLGRAKVGVLAERVRDINPLCHVNAAEEFLGMDNLDRLLAGNPDYVVDCIDNARVKAGLIAYCRRSRRPLVTVGGAGGQVDPTRIRVSDLARSAQDPLLARVRRRLRQEYGFSRNPRRRFDVPCVWSDEPMLFPEPDGGVCLQRPVGETRDLSCAGGIGSVVTVTASFGLVAAAHVLGRLAQSQKPTSPWVPSQ